jgi:hypothetical protein
MLHESKSAYYLAIFCTVVHKCCLVAFKMVHSVLTQNRPTLINKIKRHVDLFSLYIYSLQSAHNLYNDYDMIILI